MTIRTHAVMLLLIYFGFGPSDLSTYEPFRARVAVDYGPRLVGVASSDPFGNVVPICTLPNDGDTVFLCSQVLDIARSRGALEVIVGLPLDSNGKMSHKVKNFNGQLCLNFSMVLAATATIALPRASVHLFDERYTTREAKARIKSGKIKASIDAMSAVCLLERYLEDRGEGSLPAQPCSYPPPRELMYFNYNIVREHIRETYFSKPMTAEQKRIQIMQNLKEGKRPGHLMGGMNQAYSQSTGKEGEGEGKGVGVKEVDSFAQGEGGRDRDPVRKTLAGRVIGYTGMDPPAPFSSFTEEITITSNESSRDNKSEDGLTRVEIEMIEYEKIKLQRRKRGTLKKKHKPIPVTDIGIEIDVEKQNE